MRPRLLDVIEVDPDVRDLLARWARSPTVPVSKLTAEAVRKDDCDVLALQRTPGALHGVEDVEVMGPAGRLSVRVYRPSAGRLHPVLFLHGGGFVIGREGYDAPLRELALASGCLIVAPECRLAPEHPFPAALEDGLAVARWLNAEVAGLGASPEPPAVAGDSSGGNLAAIITHELTRGGTPPSDQENPTLAGSRQRTSAMRWPAVMRAAAARPGGGGTREPAWPAARQRRRLVRGMSSRVCGRADADPAAVGGSGPGQGVTVSGCAGQAACCCSSSVMATVTPRAFRAWMWVRIFLSRLVRLACQSGPRSR